MTALFDGSITDVQGICVGHAQDEAARTGVSVVFCSGEGAVGGVDVRGAAPGTRETDLLKPGNLVERVNAVVLSGGSAFGLEAATGVMRYLEEQGIGLDVGVTRVPIVPAAVLFDLRSGDGSVRPDAQMGALAISRVGKTYAQGEIGAGCGATVGKIVPGALPAQGGVGMASLRLPGGIMVGALVAVNALGDIYHPYTGEVLSCGRLPDGTKVPAEGMLYGSAPVSTPPLIGANTTLCVVATDATLDKAQVNRLATVAHDGYARAIRPVHTQMDGDTAFALASCREAGEVNFVQICAAAAEVVARAIANSVWALEGIV